MLSHVQLFATTWTVAYKLLCHRILKARVMEWVAIPFSRDLPNPGIKPKSPALQADSLPSDQTGKPSLFMNHVLCYQGLLLFF